MPIPVDGEMGNFNWSKKKMFDQSLVEVANSFEKFQISQENFFSIMKLVVKKSSESSEK